MVPTCWKDLWFDLSTDLPWGVSRGLDVGWWWCEGLGWVNLVEVVSPGCWKVVTPAQEVWLLGRGGPDEG